MTAVLATGTVPAYPGALLTSGVLLLLGGAAVALGVRAATSGGAR